MVYRNQNYMTNKKIKADVDKNQKGYISQEEQKEENIVSTNNTFNVIFNEASYNAQLADPSSGLNKYYAKYPREDGIDAEGNPVHDLNSEIVGHSWEAAITASTDPAETSSFPWVVLNMDNFIGTAEIKYDGETKYTRTWDSERQFAIFSVPNNLGMTDYRLEWGTGATGEKELNPDLIEVIYTPAQ